MTSPRLVLSTVLAVAAVTTLAVPSADARGPKPPRWRSVTINVTCEGKEPALCRGNFGFTVTSDGTFTVGPDGDGNTISEALSADELAMIAKGAEALSRTSTRAKPRCDKGPTDPASNQVVTLTKADGKTLTVYQSAIAGKGARCTVGKRADAIELETALGLLMTLHYPLPFPQE